MAQKYTFPETEKTINEFKNTIILNPNLADKSKKYFFQACSQFLSPLLSDIDITTMDRDSLGTRLSDYAALHTGTHLSNTFRWIRNFLLYLISIKFYVDKRFDFLLDYESYFPGKENAFLIDILLRKVYRHDNTAQVVNGFLHALQDSRLAYRDTLLSKSRKYLPLILRDINIETVNRFQLGQALIDATYHLSEKECVLAHRCIRRFLYRLIDQGFYCDKRFDFLQHYRSYLEDGGSLKITTLLVSERYYNYRITTYRSRFSLAVFVGASSEAVCDVVAEAFGIFAHPFDDVKLLTKHFDNSLQPYSVSTIFDFNWHTFMAQCAYLRRAQLSRVAYAYLITLYNLIAQKYNGAIFNDAKISHTFLARQDLSRLLHEGYEVVPFNPAECPPAGDKLLVCLNPNSAKMNSSILASHSRAIDFSVVAITEYRNLLKDYLWHAPLSFKVKANICNNARIFFTYLDDLHHSRTLSIFYTHHDDIIIHPGECIAYVQHIKQVYCNTGTAHQYIGTARQILQYALEKGCNYINPLSIHFLKTFVDTPNSANPISTDQLRKLSNIVNQKAQEKAENAIMACIYYLLLTTEFRFSQIATLDKNCVESAMKRGEYVLVSKQKTSNGELTEVPITSETKRHIDLVLAFTKEWRENCSDKLIANKLFIVPAHRRNTYKTIHSPRFNAFLSECCREADIPKYTTSNLRDTHMTKADEVCIRKGLSDMEKLTLFGHTSTATAEHYYIKTDIVNLLEASHGIIIGEVPIAGQISDSKDIAPNVTAVANQCGYCGKSACESYSYLSCLMCKDFVATRAQIPFFNAEITRIETKIREGGIPHDKEDLRNIQRLLLAYLARLLQEEDIHAFDSQANSPD